MLQLDKSGSHKAQDKRISPRRASLTLCVVEKCFSKNGEIPSRSVNFSATGFMLKMVYPCPLGMPSRSSSPRTPMRRARSARAACLGMVRWCKPQDGSCGGFYGVGVELASQAPRRYTY